MSCARRIVAISGFLSATVFLSTAAVTGISGASEQATPTTTPTTTSTSTSTSTTTTTTTPCPNTPVGVLKPLPVATKQVIIVTTARAQNNSGVLTAYSRIGSCWTRWKQGVRADLGIAGLALHKHESDGKTPEGIFSLGSTVYGVRSRISSMLGYHHLVCGDWWDEQTGTAQYNQFVHVACGSQPPFGGGSEPLWAITPQYDYFLAIKYNASPIRQGLGSAIFLHVSVGAPTAGCVAISESSLTQIITWLNPKAHPMIVITTTSELPQW